jgi:RNA polymerase sigma-70 factor (ECF subfamily)
MEPADADIVRRVRDGDVDAYRLLVDRHYRRCLRFAARMLGNRVDAEDAVQDTFIRAYRFLDRYEERNRFGSWLMHILVNECRAMLDRERHARHSVVGFDVVPDIPAGDESENGSRRDLATDLNAALARLEPKHREAIILKYANDLTYEDMAEVTGLRVSALKMRVKRAREHLEALLWDSTHA